MEKIIKKIPLAIKLINKIRSRKKEPQDFINSELYWEERYEAGRTSGVGSYGKFAQFKAEFINQFIQDREIDSIIEFGCGDGNQLKLANYPHYTGFDISQRSILLCQNQFSDDKTKDFYLIKEYKNQKSELTLSLDVIYHLVEDEIFDSHMRMLFKAATQYVIVYSSNFDDNSGRDGQHIRHRKFTDWVMLHCPDWKMIDRIPNKYPFKGDYKEGSFAEFFVFQKLESHPA